MHGDIGLGIDMAPQTRVARPAQRSAQSKTDSSSRRKNTVRENPYPDSHSQTLVTLRSSKVMDGLLFAEVGASMVEMDKLSGGNKKLKEGKRIDPGAVAPVGNSIPSTISSSKHRPATARPRAMTDWEHMRARRTSVRRPSLSRNNTLLSNAPSSPVRRAEQLKALLGNGGSGKVRSGAVVPSQSNVINKSKAKDSPEAVAFEQGRSRVRVALDLDLENNVAVEGGYISGTLLVRVCPKNKTDILNLGGGKIRIAGFEVAPKNEDRCIFYQAAVPLSDVSNGCAGLYELGVDDEGFGSVQEGEYPVRFSMQLPSVSTGGKPRGILNPRSGSGATIKYIIIASMKVLDPATGKRSIAHFYRDCEIWPSLDPLTTLAPAPDPMLARAAKKLFMGGDGTLALTASLHRCTWIAGQPVHVRLRIVNETKKNVRSVSLAIVRTTTLFKSGGPEFDEEMDEGETCTSERRVAEVVLAAGQKGAKGRASAKGWWTGVGPGETRSATHSIVIPPDALTIPRVRLVEVDYAVRVSLGVSSLAGTSEAVHVTLPIRIVNFISLDPPPSGPILSAAPTSVIELDTPRQETYSGSSMSGREVVDSSSDVFAHSQGLKATHAERHGYSSNQALKASTLPRNAPPPVLPTAHTVHDLGSVEDADDLNGMLGDIPGSTSILEESDIALNSTDLVDSGYSEGGHSPNDSRFGHLRGSQSAYAYTQDVEEAYEDGQSFEDGGEEEDVGSDEELEKMVGCASARIDHGAFQYPAYAYGMNSSGTSGGGSEAYPYSAQSNRASYVRPSSGARGVRGPRDMSSGQRREQSSETRSQRSRSRTTVEENINRNLPQAPSSSRTGSSDLRATCSMIQVVNPSQVYVESPDSMHSRTYVGPTLMRASPSKSLRSLASKPVVQSSQSTHLRPTASRASTVPISVQDSGYVSGLSASPTRVAVTRSAPAGNGDHKGGTPRSVRSRIAALEQKTFEEESPANGHVKRQGYVSRSLTMGAVHSYA